MDVAKIFFQKFVFNYCKTQTKLSDETIIDEAAKLTKKFPMGA